MEQKGKIGLVSENTPGNYRKMKGRRVYGPVVTAATKRWSTLRGGLCERGVVSNVKEFLPQFYQGLMRAIKPYNESNGLENSTVTYFISLIIGSDVFLKRCNNITYILCISILYYRNASSIKYKNSTCI